MRTRGAVLIAVLAGCAPWREQARTWAPEQAAISEQLAAQARPIGMEEDGGLDVEPLWQMVGEARVVGVGEATHGTREFRLLMNAVVRRAAAEDRPVVVALEMTFNQGLMLDAWVGDSWYPPTPGLRDRPLDEVLGTGWLGDSEEHRALYAWIREYNRGAGPGRGIRVVGVDECLHHACFSGLGGYFDAVDPMYAERARGLLAKNRHLMKELFASEVLAGEVRAALAELRERLVGHRAQYVALRGEPAHAVALRLVWLAERRVDAAVAEGDTAITGQRDRWMADNVRWISERMPEARILLFAHNGHIARGTGRLANGRMSQGPVMGQEIGRSFGDEYVAVNTAFDRGSFLAHHTRSPLARWPRGRALQSFPVEPAPRGTLEATLRRDGVYALDVRRAAAGESALARYLRGWQWMRWHTFAWRKLYQVVPVAWTGVRPADSFDVLVFFKNGTATTPHVPAGEEGLAGSLTAPGPAVGDPELITAQRRAAARGHAVDRAGAHRGVTFDALGGPARAHLGPET